MIVKRLRIKKGWSQDQLATLTGLSIRTIQRVEAGNPASLETINSLSSVFETDITQLTEEINVIDKTTEEWKEAPGWVRTGVWGIRKRETVLWWEKGSAIAASLGCVLTLGSLMLESHPIMLWFSISLIPFWAAAYWYAIAIRWIDNKKLWL